MFRRGLDIAKASDASGKSGLFDLALANDLYATLLAPMEPLLRDKRSLLVVPQGALTALPFHLLVTEKPDMAIPDNFDGYRNAAWLLKRHAVSVLPSVTSLKALRAFARRDQSIKPMTGFGDPLFDPAQGAGDRRGAAKTASRSVASIAYTEFWRGAGVDRAMLAQALPQLPDTADELNAVAKDLGVAVGRHPSRRRRQRDHAEARKAVRLFDRLFRHPRPRRRRYQGSCRAVAGAQHSRRAHANSTMGC